MRGLRIQKRKDVRTRCDFALCFRSILPLLHDLHWIVPQGCFGQFPQEWSDASTYDVSSDRFIEGPLATFEDLRRDAADGYEAYAPGLLPEFAVGITEDWNELFGFREPVASLQEWIQGRWSSAKTEHVAATASLCFLNVDGAYWEIHSRDLEMIEAVRADMETEASVVVVAAKLEESYGL